MVYVVQRRWDNLGQLVVSHLLTFTALLLLSDTNHIHWERDRLVVTHGVKENGV